jgi:phosphate transport system substrate-binding protein
MAVTAAAAIVLTASVLTACGSKPASSPPASPSSGVSLAGAAASVPASAPRILSETGSSLMAPSYLHAQDPAGWGSSLIGITVAWPSATRPQDLRAFLTWALTSGTAQLSRVHFQPLPPAVITLSDAQIARIRGRAG